MSVPKSRLRWFQFSLRTLLAFVMLSAILCGWIVVRMQQIEKQMEEVKAFEETSGMAVSFEPLGPAWLRAFVEWRHEVTDAGEKKAR